jgi:hypothetical protein
MPRCPVALLPCCLVALIFRNPQESARAHDVIKVDEKDSGRFLRLLPHTPVKRKRGIMKIKNCQNKAI